MPDQPRELTAAHVEQAGRLLMPSFREAVRAEIAPLAGRVAELEKTNRRALAGWTFLVSVVTFLGTTLGGAVVSWARAHAGMRP